MRRSSSIGRRKAHQHKKNNSEAKGPRGSSRPPSDNNSSRTNRKPGVRAGGHRQRSPRASRMSARMCLSMTATSTRRVLWDTGCQRMRCPCQSGRQGRTPAPKGSLMMKPPTTSILFPSRTWNGLKTLTAMEASSARTVTTL